MSEPPTDRAINRLAQYRPFAHRGQEVQAALQDLVLGSAAEAGGAFEHLGACRDAIQTLFGLEIELDELRDCIVRLEAAGKCTTSGGGFTLSDDELARLEEQAAESRAVEESAFRAWEEALRRLDPELSTEDFEALRSDLDLWLQRVISRHGVEAALILYPENPRARSLYTKIEELGLNFLPERTRRLRKLREQAIQTFIRQPTAEQRRHLSNLLNVSYFLTVLSLDPQASHIVQAQVNGHRVYLDTNVLYRVLGLSKMPEVLAVRRLLELTKELGFELAITPWTLTEMQESLRRAEESVKQRALPPREWAHLMADATTQEGFVKAYWIQYREKGVTPDDFFAFYSALQRMLEEDGIQVVDEGLGNISDDEVEDQLPVLASLILWERPDVVLRHDIKHRLLVERLRGAGNLTFASARYWFLTQDSVLPRYAEVPRQRQDEVVVPFCASTSAWAQVVRSLVPRTEDLDQALVDLLASPYMRYRGGVSPQAVQEIVARIDQFQGVSVELASEVLLNGALVREISHTDDPAARQDKIDNALISGATDLHTKVEKLSQIDVEQREAVRMAEAEAASTRHALGDAQERIRQLEAEIREQANAEQTIIRRLESAERVTATAQAAAEQAEQSSQQTQTELLRRLDAAEQSITLQKRRDDQRRRRARLAAAIVIWVGAVAGTGVALGFGHVVGTWPIVGILVGASVLASLGAWVAFGFHRAWQAFLVLTVLIGFVAALQQVVAAALDDGEPTTSTTGR